MKYQYRVVSKVSDKTDWYIQYAKFKTPEEAEEYAKYNVRSGVVAKDEQWIIATEPLE